MEEVLKKSIDKDKSSKSVIIDGGVHSDLKTFCLGKNLKIGGVIENLIRLYLKDYKNVQKQIDNINEPEIK